jgi:nucleotide-binding universal stress UspA family protein
MMPHSQPPVLVGVDGSRGSLHALGLASAEADLRQVPLRIMHVARADPEAGRAILADAAARVRRLYPHLPVAVSLRHGYRPGPILVEESERAALTVLGCRGMGGLSATLAGSVSSHVACRGSGPVVTVRGDAYLPSGRPVVVGVDGSAECDAAIGFAFEESALRLVPLHAILVWVHPPLADLGPVAPPGCSFADAELDAAAELEAALAGWRQKYPDVQVHPTLIHSRRAARKLLATTTHADLVVIGSRARGQVRGLLGGSVGHTLVHHGQCPIAVVHPEHPSLTSRWST